MSNLFASASYMNATEGYRIGDDPPTETFTDDRGELYRHCVKEYGRCISRVYIGDGIPIGWAFLKRVEYDDARPSWPKERRSFLRETWVMLHAAPDEVTTTRHYLNAVTGQPVN